MYPADWTAASILVDTFHQIPPACDAKAFVRELLEICRHSRVNFLIPLTDVEVDVLSPNRDLFRSAGTILCLSDQDAISKCRDKLKLYETFKGDDLIATIPTWDIDNLSESMSPFPLIAKPRSGRSSEGLLHIHTQRELDHHMTLLDGAGYIVQPHLEGSIHVTDIVRQQASGRCAAMTRRELLRTVNGAGLTVEMVRDEVLNNYAKHIATRLDINGCVNIEFLMHEGRALLMDINPRFSAGVAFTKLAGYDMVANHLRCFGSEPIEDCVPPRASIYTRHYVEISMTRTNQPARLEINAPE